MTPAEAFAAYAAAHKRSVTLGTMAAKLGAAGREDEARALMLRRATAASESWAARRAMDTALAEEAWAEMRGKP